MGNARSVWKRICDKVYGNKEVRILMCGLDAAGKTTVLYKLKLGEVVTTIPTIGFNVETITYNGINFTTWDISGRDGIRPLWRHYYQNTEVVIFVIDSNDRERISECKDELWRFVQEDELKDCIFLVMANKQDLPNAMSTAEITETLELNALSSHTWYVQGTCATSGDGLYEGLSWLHEQLQGNQVKKTITKPLQETKDSVTKSGRLSSWFASLSGYFSSSSPTSTQVQETSTA